MIQYDIIARMQDGYAKDHGEKYADDVVCGITKDASKLQGLQALVNSVKECISSMESVCGHISRAHCD